MVTLCLLLNKKLHLPRLVPQPTHLQFQPLLAFVLMGSLLIFSIHCVQAILFSDGTPCTLPDIPARLCRRRWTAKEEYGELRTDAFLVQVLLEDTIAKVGRFFVAPSAASLCPFDIFFSDVLVHEGILSPLHHGILDVVL